MIIQIQTTPEKHKLTEQVLAMKKYCNNKHINFEKKGPKVEKYNIALHDIHPKFCF